MSNLNDGGPAFPQADLSGYGIGPERNMAGVSVRDYFAAHALIGVLAARNGFLVDVGVENAAPWAYQVADAMLAARSKEPTHA